MVTPSATAPVEVKEEAWEDDGYSYKKDYSSKGADWKKADEEMRPEPKKIPHFVPPPPPPASPRASQPPTLTGPRPAAVQPLAKAMPTAEQIAAKAKAKAVARNLRVRELVTRQMAEEQAAMLERILASVGAVEGDEE